MEANKLSISALRWTVAIGACAIVSSTAINGDAPFTAYSAAGTRSVVADVVDAFRAALGPTNGDLPGPQPEGRRDITWDESDLCRSVCFETASGVTLFPGPMTTFNDAPTTRGAVFVNACVVPPFCAAGGFMISSSQDTFFGEGTFFGLSGRVFGPAPLQPPVTDVQFFVAGTTFPPGSPDSGSSFRTSICRTARPSNSSTPRMNRSV